VSTLVATVWRHTRGAGRGGSRRRRLQTPRASLALRLPGLAPERQSPVARFLPPPGNPVLAQPLAPISCSSNFQKVRVGRVSRGESGPGPPERVAKFGSRNSYCLAVCTEIRTAIRFCVATLGDPPSCKSRQKVCIACTNCKKFITRRESTPDASTQHSTNSCELCSIPRGPLRPKHAGVYLARWTTRGALDWAEPLRRPGVRPATRTGSSAPWLVRPCRRWASR